MEKIRRFLSLRIKLLITVVGVVLLFLSISTYFSIKQTGQIIKDQIESYGNSMSKALADFCIEDLLSWNYPALQLYVDYIGEQDSQIKGIKIYHHDSIIAEYCSGEDNDEDSAFCAPDLPGVFSAPVEIRLENETKRLGKVEVYLSKEKYQEFLNKQIRLLLILSFAMLIGDSVLSYWTVKLLMLNPLRDIYAGTKIIGDGNFNHKIELKNKDEIGDLANAINSMSEKLRFSHEKMTKQTSHLKEVQLKLMQTLNETRDAKEKIEEEQNKTFAMISNLVDPVIVIDNEQKIILVNPSAKRILGIREDEIGKKIKSLCDGRECIPKRLCLCDFRGLIKVEYKSKVIKLNNQKYPIIEELTIGDLSSKKKLDAEINKVFKVLTSEVKDEKGNSFGHMKIFYDLTKEKIVDEMKSEFISIAAHQLRTPSSGVNWALKMILDGEMGKIPEEARQYLEKAAEANQQMVDLVKDLLNVSYIETGKFVYNFEKTNLATFIETIVEKSRIFASQSNITLIFSKPTTSIPEISLDQEKISLAIQNIINNAIKYSKEKGVVEISISYSSNNKADGINILIKDQGIGISKKDQSNLFSKFYRGDNAKKLQTEGSGLGLFITKKVIEAHGGKILCQSEDDKGTVFTIKIPV